ncbi:hypothetical protein MKZ38_006749 [Zalerion maritima]|uniref:eRF1/Pelota-like N-terminal domain-containing protein n=1 Tax=Zalerion maritima TaxID=339359 RepID=A0AAD5RNB6_9PEZI|nr:hypothetical protein MKZ38_006749 [Zalerion maritima]
MTIREPSLISNLRKMRVLNRNLPEILSAQPGSAFYVDLIPTDDDDLWNLYNLLHPGDLITALTTRKVKLETDGGGEPGDASKKANDSRREIVKLTISLRKPFFDPTANELRLTGITASDTEVVGSGVGHSLTISNGTQLRIEKPEEDGGWSSVDLTYLKEILTGEKQDAIPAIIMQQGRAALMNIRQNRNVIVARIESPNVRTKGTALSKGRDKATDAHHEKIIAAIRLHILDAMSPPAAGARTASSSRKPPDVPRLLLVSPGFWADEFRKYALHLAISTEDKKLRALVDNAAVVSSGVGLAHGISAIMSDPKVQGMMKNMRFGVDNNAVDRFTRAIKKDETRAWYGPGPVEKAVAQGAVGPGEGELLILDKLFRSTDLETRKKWVAMVDRVKADGGKVNIISDSNPSGEQLKNFGGVAAILTFPMEDLDDDAPVYLTDSEEEDYVV